LRASSEKRGGQIFEGDMTFGKETHERSPLEGKKGSWPEAKKVHRWPLDKGEFVSKT